MLPTCILSQCIAYFANIDKDAEIRTTYYYVHVMSGGGKMPKVNVDDINVYYEVHGKGEPLAFIAGLGSYLTIWFRHIPVFSKEYQSIVYI